MHFTYALREGLKLFSKLWVGKWLNKCMELQQFFPWAWIRGAGIIEWRVDILFFDTRFSAFHSTSYSVLSVLPNLAIYLLRNRSFELGSIVWGLLAENDLCIRMGFDCEHTSDMLTWISYVLGFAEHEVYTHIIFGKKKLIETARFFIKIQNRYYIFTQYCILSVIF